MHPTRPLLACALALAALAAGESAATLRIDGSSTVYPITLAAAEQFAGRNPQVQIEVGVSGSSAGLRRMIGGGIDIANSSRAIKPAELKALADRRIAIVELPIAYDGITVFVRNDNRFIDHLTTAELKRLWEADSPVRRWSQVRAGWPETPVALFGPGRDSGTNDYFSEEICGKPKALREDATTSEDDNELVQGVVGSPGGLGYFGMAYFAENAAMLRAVPIDAGKGPVGPSADNVRAGTYRPLSRVLFLYVKAASLERPETMAFLDDYLRRAPGLVGQIGYVPLPARAYDLVRERLARRITGSAFAKAAHELGVERILTEDAAVQPGGDGEAAATAAAKPAAMPQTPAIAPIPAQAAAAAKPAAVAPVQAAAAVAPAPVQAAAAPAWRPAASAAEIAAMIESLRRESLALARASLDPDQPVEALARRSAELRQRTDALTRISAGSASAATLRMLQEAAR